MASARSVGRSVGPKSQHDRTTAEFNTKDGHLAAATDERTASAKTPPSLPLSLAARRFLSEILRCYCLSPSLSLLLSLTQLADVALSLIPGETASALNVI